MLNKPLIDTPNMPWFENPEKAREIREDNKAFQEEQRNATPEKTAKMQQWAKIALYWESVEQENQNSIDKLDGDSKYFPNLKALYESWHIDAETFIKTSEKLEEAKPDEELEIFVKVVNNLSDTSVRDSIIKWLENKQEINEYNFDKTEFAKDSKTLNLDLDKGVWWLELMLARNYISINNVDWTQDKTRDLSKSMDTTLNEILKNSSLDFRKQNWPLISEIKSEKNLDRKYILLKELYKEDLKRDAILWGKKWIDEINRKKYNLMEKAKEINEKINEAQKITDENQKKKELWKLKLDKKLIIEEWKNIDLFEGEIQTSYWWKQDKEAEILEKWDEI